MQKKHNILIVDDIPENLQVLDDMLEREGYEVLVAGNGFDALENAVVSPVPDLILLDIMMPDMDGYEVCRRLKADDATRDIPVIFLTALASSEDETRGLELGAVDYITKPFKLELVKARVANHINLRKAQLELQRYNRQLEEMVQERTKQLVEANRRLTMLDSAQNDFLHSISHELRTPANGVLSVGQLAIFSIEDSSERQKLQVLFDVSSARLVEALDVSLQLAEIQAGDSWQQLKRIELEGSLLAVQERVREYAEHKALSYSVSGSAHHYVMGTETLVQQALVTLFHALILLADVGSNIGVDITCEPDLVRIGIKACGKLLPEEEIQTFFDLFSPNRSSSYLQSLGFALPLSAKIIMSLGGTVDVRNGEEGVNVVACLKSAP